MKTKRKTQPEQTKVNELTFTRDELQREQEVSFLMGDRSGQEKGYKKGFEAGTLTFIVALKSIGLYDEFQSRTQEQSNRIWSKV